MVVVFLCVCLVLCVYIGWWLVCVMCGSWVLLGFLVGFGDGV
jgi:hypothetical protein